MANRSADTIKFQTRPPQPLVDALERLFPQVGLKTANELAVRLIAEGVKMLEAKRASGLSPGMRALRSLLHGDGADADGSLSSLSSADDFRSMVREMMREEMPRILEQAQRLDQEAAKGRKQNTARNG